MTCGAPCDASALCRRSLNAPLVIERRIRLPCGWKVRRLVDFKPVHSGSTNRAHFVCSAIVQRRHESSAFRGDQTACPHTSHGCGAANWRSLKSWPNSGAGEAELSVCKARSLETHVQGQTRGSAFRRAGQRPCAPQHRSRAEAPYAAPTPRLRRRARGSTHIVRTLCGWSPAVSLFVSYDESHLTHVSSQAGPC